ncbi:hypothetical protein [Rhizobium sp. RU36D]|uniref:hypothetical protein n=1 Tax=Rhizobium sp. RU36D TaxID=1907415 RepID=UPI0015C49B2D|nr:hypothetical protein [Rhizobium sp. RU36D]
MEIELVAASKSAMPVLMRTDHRHWQKAAFILQDHKLLPARFFASYSCKALSRLS